MLPYSEPDQDLSPPDNTDWNWGGGQARPPDSAAVAENVGLTEKILADTNNVISEYGSIDLINKLTPFLSVYVFFVLLG